MKMTHPAVELIEQNETLLTLKNRMIVREGKSEETLRRYLDGIKAFTEFMKAANPDEALKSFSESKDRTANLDSFVDYLLAKGAKPISLKALFQGVKKWLIANRVNEIDYAFISRPKVASQIKDRIPTTEELQLILNNKVMLRDKAMFLTAASGGLRLGTLVTLQVGDFEAVEDLGKITVNGGEGRKLAKGKSYFTFVTPETRKIIEQYLKTRPSVKSTDPLFAKDGSNEPIAHFVQNVSRQWRRLIKRANLMNKIPGHRWMELHGHTLRKFFQTHAKLSGCRADFVDFWLGHHPSKVSEYLNDSYFRPSEEEHISEYRKAVDSLQVYEKGTSANSFLKEELSDLKKDVRRLNFIIDLLEKQGSLKGMREALKASEAGIKIMKQHGLVVDK